MDIKVEQLKMTAKTCEAASGVVVRVRRERGAVLMEVVFALSLFFVAGAFVMDGLNGAIRGVDTIRLEADATDLAVTTFSEVQMGLMPLESVGPVGVAYAGAEGWTYELIVSGLDDMLELAQLKKLEIIVRNETTGFTYSTTHLIWDNPNPQPALPGVDQIPGGDLAGQIPGDLADLAGAAGGGAGGGAAGGNLGRGNFPDATPAFPGGAGGGRGTGAAPAFPGGGGRGNAGDATPRFPQGGNNNGGDATPRFPQRGGNGNGNPAPPADATPRFPQRGNGGNNGNGNGRGNGTTPPPPPANLPDLQDGELPQRPPGGNGGQRGGGQRGGGQRGGGGNNNGGQNGGGT